MDESVALLLLPGPLEGLAFEAHARSLLAIPRVIALEPGRMQTPRLMRDGVAERQAQRIRLPGSLRAVILYQPAQYPLARALSAVHGAELWYLRAGFESDDPDLTTLDAAAQERAAGMYFAPESGEIDDAPLRERLRELGVISARAFVPTARFARWRLRRRKADKSD